MKGADGEPDRATVTDVAQRTPRDAIRDRAF
jgi:hypothetical protein